MNFIHFSAWYRGEKKKMKFAVPRLWREPTDHISDCYFCVVNPRKRRTGKNAKKIQYSNSLKAVIHGFLGNKKDENYKELISNMIESFKVMGCRMSLKVHMLHTHLDKFKNNLGEYSEEQEERFHQDIMIFEQRYQGQYNANMMGDYIWELIRESSEFYARKTNSIHFKVFFLYSFFVF